MGVTLKFIIFLYEYLSTLDSTDHYVMQDTGCVKAGLSWHGFYFAFTLYFVNLIFYQRPHSSRGVFSGIDFLRKFAEGEKVQVGSRVAIIGGGNTAIDAARTCLRIGASEATIVYRRSRMEMPASHREIKEAEDEGVKFFLMAAPTRITPGDGFLNLEVQRMKLGEPDQSGRRRPVPVPGSESVMQVDSVIAAIGQLVEIGKCHVEGLTEGLGDNCHNIVHRFYCHDIVQSQL